MERDYKGLGMTTQSRFWVSTHQDFEKAHKAKEEFKNDNPDSVIQIRRGKEKGKEVFRLVERFKLNAVRAIQDTKRTNKKSKRRTRPRREALA